MLIAAILITVAAVLKVTTFPFSINPIIAIALFSGAIISDKKLAFMMPLLAMFVSDVLLEISNIAPGFYGMSQLGNYAALLFVTVLGFSLKKTTPLRVAGYSIASSVLFFFLSNSSCYLFDTTLFYGTGITGWMNCLVAGIPFLKNGMVIDLCFSILLFGSYHFAFRKKTMPGIAE